MRRGSSSCDFCAVVQRLQPYSADVPGVEWYVCQDCVKLIRREDWGKLIERSVEAHVTLRRVPEDEQNMLRRQAEDLVNAFRTFCLQPV